MACWLPRLSFIEPEDQLLMFSFLDLNLVVCGVYIIPSFAYDFVEEPLELPAGQQPVEDDNADYYLYYVNM